MSSTKLEVSFFGVLSILVITINSCVCLLVYSKKKLRTSTNFFVVSLAVSDLLTGVTQFCIYLLQLKVRLFFNITYALSCFGGITTLCGVTWDRYVAVMDPLKYHDIVPKHFKAVIAASWSFAVIVAFMPLTWVLDDAGDVDLHQLIHKIYQFVTVSLGIVIPYMVIVWAQFCIYQKAKNCMRKDLQMANPNGQRKMFRRLYLEAKVARIFIIVAAMFFISWFPMTFYTLAFAAGQPQMVPRVLIYDIAPAFISLRSFINPIAYSLMKLDFLDVLKSLLKMQRNQERFNRFSLQESNLTVSLRLSSSSNASVTLSDKVPPAQRLMMESSV